MASDHLAEMQKLIDHFWDTGGREVAEAEMENESRLLLDEAVYGVRVTDAAGKRIDPRTITLPSDQPARPDVHT